MPARCVARRPGSRVARGRARCPHCHRRNPCSSQQPRALRRATKRRPGARAEKACPSLLPSPTRECRLRRSTIRLGIESTPERDAETLVDVGGDRDQRRAGPGVSVRPARVVGGAATPLETIIVYRRPIHWTSIDAVLPIEAERTATRSLSRRCRCPGQGRRRTPNPAMTATRSASAQATRRAGTPPRLPSSAWASVIV